MFDPTYPPANAEIESAPLRDQFNSLKTLIDAIPAGPQGPAGPEGPPGEVTQDDLDMAINGTSNNSDGVELLDLSFEDPPSITDMETIGNKINEILQALRRNP